jgi:hypothetical protein
MGNVWKIVESPWEGEYCWKLSDFFRCECGVSRWEQQRRAENCEQYNWGGERPGAFLGGGIGRIRGRERLFREEKVV